MDQFKLCREGFKTDLSYLAMLMPLARTPMDKKSASNMKTMIKDIEKNLDKITAWENAKDRYEAKKKKYAKMGIMPGEVVVLSEGMPNVGQLPIFEGAKIIGKT